MSGFADAVLPCGCAVCGAAVRTPGSPVCQLCSSRITPVPPPWCPRCGLTRVLPAPGPGLCSECFGWSAAVRRAASSCLHQGAAAELVRGLKYRGWTGLVELMAGLMLPAARRVAEGTVPVLVPVPLSAAKKRERGFNQAELLARAISRNTGWRVSELLRRSRSGPALVHLGRRQRERAATGAYTLDRRATDPFERLPPVVIVDDVITTGATGAACAEALEAAGATCLGIVSFCRTDPLAGST